MLNKRFRRKSMRILVILGLVIIFIAPMLVSPPNSFISQDDLLQDYRPDKQHMIAVDYDIEIDADTDDDWWKYNATTPEWTHYTTGDEIFIHNETESLQYLGQLRWPITVPQGATILSADFTAYETQDSTVRTSTIKRIDETNVGSLEGDSIQPVVDNSSTADYAWDASGAEWGDPTDITVLLQTQVNLPDWESGFYFGIRVFFNYTATGMHRFEDYQAVGINHSYLNISYTESPESNLSFYSYEIQSDGDDDNWNYDSGWTHITTGTEVIVREYPAVGENVGQFRFQLDIPKDAIIYEATITVYEVNDAMHAGAWVWRINEIDVGALESDSSLPSANKTIAAFHIFDKTTGWTTTDVTELVQAQVDLAGWTSGYHIGLQFNTTTEVIAWNGFQDSQAGTNQAYINVTYMDSADDDWLVGWNYRQSHLFSQTIDAGINYTLRVNVSLGSGDPFNYTAYVDGKALTDFGDIRFTTANGTLLAYNLSQTINEAETDYFTYAAVDYGYHTINYPCSYYYNGITYFAFEGDPDLTESGLDIYIMSYNHATDEWSGIYYVGHNFCADDEAGDVHGAPALWVDNLGYINILYGAHNEPVTYSRSVNPEDITNWEYRRSLDSQPQFTYPKILYDSIDNVVHLMYRYQYTDGYMQQSYVNSTDYGVTWSTPQVIIYFTTYWKWPLADIMDFDSDGKMIHFGMRYRNGTVPSQNDEDIYYMRLNVTTGHLFNGSGYDLGVQIDETTELQSCKVYESGEDAVFGPVVHIDENKVPYIMFSDENGGSERTLFTYWNGTGWEPLVQVSDPNSMGSNEFIVHDSTNITAFVSDSEDIQRYTWDGASWTWQEEIYDSSKRVSYTITPVNYVNELMVFFTDYDVVLDGAHQKMYAWGTSGRLNGTIAKYACFYVEILDDLDLNDSVIYVYYGKSDATTTGISLTISESPWVSRINWGDEEQVMLWLDRFMYRKQHTILQTAGAGVGHTVPFEIYFGEGTDSGNTTYLDNEPMMPGLDDIRFTLEDMTLLDYWLENYYYSDTPTDEFGLGGGHFGFYLYNYPNAYYYNNRTYVAYMSAGYRPTLIYYDHENATWSPAYIASTYGVLANDDHGSPAMWVDNQGYINVIYGAHGHPFDYVKSTYPERIDEWTTMDRIGEYGPDATSYACVSYDTTNHVAHLIARDKVGDDYIIGYRNSTDGGETWSDKQSVVLVDDTIYVPYKGSGVLDPDDSNILHVNWATYNITYFDESASVRYEDVRYCYINVSTGTVYNVTGDSMGTTITIDEFDDVLVFEGGHCSVTVTNVRVYDGDPYLAFTISNTSSTSTKTSMMVYWNSTDSLWSGPHNITWNFGQGSCVILIHDATNITAFATDGVDMSRYSWDGYSWTKEETIIEYEHAGDLDGRLIFPSVPVNYNGTIQFVFTESIGGQGSSNKMYAWGTSGIVQKTPITGAKVWVKIPYDLSSQSVDIYMYYGNVTASITSSPFSISYTPVPNHGTWRAAERIYVSANFSISSFGESLPADTMFFADDDDYTISGNYIETYEDVADWTSAQGTVTTDGDVGSVEVPGDASWDYYTSNNISLSSGFYALWIRHKDNESGGTSFSRLRLYESDDATGSYTYVFTYLYSSTSWDEAIYYFECSHAIESIFFYFYCTSSDTKFDFDFLRIGNMSGWAHDGSSTTHTTTTSGATVSSDGDYISLIDDGDGSTVYFEIDDTATAWALDSDISMFMYLDFHEDDSNNLFAIYTIDDTAAQHLIVGPVNTTDRRFNLRQSDEFITRIRLQIYSGDTTRIDQIRIYSIFNWTITNRPQSDDGVLYVENGALKSSSACMNLATLEYEPAISIDTSINNAIVVNRTLYGTYLDFETRSYVGAWTDWDAHGYYNLTSGTLTAFQMRIGSAGILYSIEFGATVYNESEGLEQEDVDNAPVNVQSSECSNLDDTDNLYANYKQYQIEVYTSDADGYADITYIEFTLYSNDQVTPYWTVRYTEVTDTFSEQSDTSNMITLDAASSTNSSSGNELNATYYVTMHWNHTDLTDTDAKCYVLDDDANSDTDWYEINWDIETRTTAMSAEGPELEDGIGTEGRGNYDTIDSITASFGLKYYTSNNIYPPSDEVDVWWYCSDIAGSPWEATNYNDATGLSSVTVDSDDIVGLDTYYIKVVIEDAGISGTDLMHDTWGDTYIADRLVIDIQADDETPINGMQVNFTLTVTYEYDSASCTTYTIQIDRNATNWYIFVDGNKSLFNDTNSFITYLYNATSSGAGVSESTHGLTAFITNTETIVWFSNNPVIQTVSNLINADDSDNLYARYKFYIITTNVTDGDGYADIHMILLMLWDNGESINYWTISYNENDNSFTVVNGSAYISLGSCAYSKSGNYVNITWYIKIDWDHADLTDTDTKAFANDTASYDADWYEADWDVETRLDYSVGFSLDDESGTSDRGDLNGTITASGIVNYYGSAIHPLANETDVWISSTGYGAISGPWMSDVNATGGFEYSVYADDFVGLDTLTCKIVANDTGSGGTDLYYTTSLTDTYIADIFVYSWTVADESQDANEVLIRQEFDQAPYMFIYIFYAYDHSVFTSSDGSASFESSEGGWISLVWDNILYRWIGPTAPSIETKSSATDFLYNAISITDNLHGISGSGNQGALYFDGSGDAITWSYGSPISTYNLESDWVIRITFYAIRTGGVQTLFSFGDVSNDAHHRLRISDWTTENFTLAYYNSNGFGSWLIAGSDKALAYEEWHVITLMRTDSRFYWWVNDISGSVLGETEIGESCYVVLGSDEDRSSFWFKGYIGDFVVLDNSLSEVQIEYGFHYGGFTQLTEYTNAELRWTYGHTTADGGICYPEIWVSGASVNASKTTTDFLYDFSEHHFNGTRYGDVAVGFMGNYSRIWYIWDRIIIGIQADGEFLLNGATATFTIALVYDWDNVTVTDYQFRAYRNATYWKYFTDSNISFFIDVQSSVCYYYDATYISPYNAIDNLYSLILWYNNNTEYVTWSARIEILWSGSVPLDAYTEENVTFSALIDDDYFGTSNVWLKAITAPVGFSDIYYSMTLIQENLYIYTFSTLFEGFYAFEVIASDSHYNSTLDADSLIVLRIRLFVESAFGEIRFAFFDTADNWVPFETINCNLTQSGNEYALTSATATVSTAINMTLEVFNKWGILISNTTFDYTQFKAVTLGLYELVVDNMADHKVRLDISYNGTYPNITIQLPARFPRFLYLASANYTMIFTYYAPVSSTNDIIDYNLLTGYYVTYNYELIGGGYLEYTGVGMTDIMNNVDYTRAYTNDNIDAVDINVLAIPFPPNVPQNIVTPQMLWILVVGIGIFGVFMAVAGHGIKGYAIAKKTKVFYQKPENKSNDESFRDEGMPT